MEKINRWTEFFLRKPQAFIQKRELNWVRIKWSAGISLLCLVIILLCLPTKVPQRGQFNVKANNIKNSQAYQYSPKREISKNDTNLNSFAMLSFSEKSNFSKNKLPNRNMNASMLLPRGADSKNSLPFGYKFEVYFDQSLIIGSQTIPVIGLVGSDVYVDDQLAIPKSTQIFGNAVYDENLERAQIHWIKLRFLDGREKQIDAQAISQDGQIGIEGVLHSDSLKNTLGQTITKFVSAYAEGSMQKGSFGANPGGSENGFKNAITETTKERAEAWAQDIQKTKKWIEIPSGSHSFALLNSNFQFTENGVFYGK